MNLHNPEMMQNNFSAAQTLSIAESSANFDPIFRPEFMHVLEQGHARAQDSERKSATQDSNPLISDMELCSYL